METSYQVKRDGDLYFCEDIGVSAKEWYALLQEPKAELYLPTLLKFLQEQGHKSSCKLMSQKYGGTPNSYNAMVINCGKWVRKTLDRFHIYGTDGNESYWIIPMKEGVHSLDGFQWSLRDELVEALELYIQNNPHIINDMNFTWIPFFQELADKLLTFKSDRKALVDIVYSLDNDVAGYIKGSDKDGHVSDIDPFTVIGIFNRNQTFENRKKLALEFKEKFNILADAPADFDGIPVLNPQKAMFFAKHREVMDIQPLWDFFEAALKGDRTELGQWIDVVRKQQGIKWNLTMGLYWIRPYDYISLDSRNREYLPTLGVDVFKDKELDAAHYFHLLDVVMDKIQHHSIKEKSIPEISFNAWMGVEQSEEDKSWYDDMVDIWKRRKNVVLCGAPGTGKTYDVPELAVRLCTPSFDANHASRKELMEQYNRLKEEKRVMFTTFHQSMDYEDWMEGVRAQVTEDNQVCYSIEPGIFKKLCEEIKRPIIRDKATGIADDAVVWKVSLYGTGENPVRTDCMKNNYIRIGWDDYGPVISDETDWKTYNGEGRQILDAFINKMKVGDIVMSCYSNRTIDAVGVVVGDYEYLDSLPNYKRIRRVKWIVKGINENIVEMNEGKCLTLGTVYRLNSITLDKVKSILDKYEKPLLMEDNTLPYVMVIDEMNRGNVSKIFGELITLLEPDKRKGSVNAESVILPYSKEVFQIPGNIYILATMNTADRSLGTLDYAVRRRFAFISSRPYELDRDDFDRDLFKKVSGLFVSNYETYKEAGWSDTFPLLPADTLSEDYRPEDVWIGHSYFLMNEEHGQASERLLYEIIPLLEEYVRDGVLKEEAIETIHELYSMADE